MSEDKTEKPTDKKIEDAREKGQVPIGKDVARLCTLTASAEIAFLTEQTWRESSNSLFDLAIMRIGSPFQAALWEMYASAGLILIVTFAIYYVSCVVTGVAGHWGQFGVLIAPKALEPKFEKLNPVNGFKQLFSMKKVVEALLTVFKATVIGVIVYVIVRNQLPNIVSLSNGVPKDVFSGFITLLRSAFHSVLMVCLLLALIDLGVQRHNHTKDLMMDMEEIKKEYKETEGDPLVKGQRKQLARELAMSDPVSSTANANAVVVNPSHFAVAMLYDLKKAPVPIVLAKGRDLVAQAMIQRARSCGIPVIRHVWLARTLYATCRRNSVIPKASYNAAAYVYAVVFELVAMHETDREIELESEGRPPEPMN